MINLEKPTEKEITQEWDTSRVIDISEIFSKSETIRDQLNWDVSQVKSPPVFIEDSFYGFMAFEEIVPFMKKKEALALLAFYLPAAIFVTFAPTKLFAIKFSSLILGFLI